MNTRIGRYKIEEAEGWRELAFKIPFIPIREGWRIAPIPPFAGAAARFRVQLPDGQIKSVYLDVNDSLGYYGKPYWEVHPYRGDCGRCDMENVDELVEMIADTQGDEP